MNATHPVSIDSNGTLTIPDARPGTYVATLRTDGSILVEPAQTLTNAQIAQLSRPDRVVSTPTEREARKAIVHALYRATPNVTGPAVQKHLEASGFPVALRTAYLDLDDARAQRNATNP